MTTDLTDLKPNQWRKKPVVVTAVQLNTIEEAGACKGVCTGSRTCRSSWPHIHTLEGDHTWTAGDWCITGVNGEHYFCKPDIFAKTYEAAHRQASVAVQSEPVAWLSEWKGSNGELVRQVFLEEPYGSSRAKRVPLYTHTPTERERALLEAGPITDKALAAIGDALDHGLSDIEIEAALHAVDIYTYGPDATKFETMFAAAMKCRASIATGNKP